MPSGTFDVKRWWPGPLIATGSFKSTTPLLAEQELGLVNNNLKIVEEELALVNDNHQTVEQEPILVKNSLL